MWHSCFPCLMPWDSISPVLSNPKSLHLTTSQSSDCSPVIDLSHQVVEDFPDPKRRALLGYILTRRLSFLICPVRIPEPTIAGVL